MSDNETEKLKGLLPQYVGFVDGLGVRAWRATFVSLKVESDKPPGRTLTLSIGDVTGRIDLSPDSCTALAALLTDAQPAMAENAQ